MISNFIKKVFGIDKIEQQTADAVKAKLEAEAAAAVAKETERLAKLTPKELATERKEPWVSVLETHINQENIRNGFFELDWNEYFILQLKTAGYSGDSEEQIVDAWFSELCKNVGTEAGVNMDRRSSGYVQRALRDDGKTEIG